MPLLNRANSVLVIIDVQQRLAPAIHDVDSVMKRIAVLAQAAAMLEVPIVATEQYPAGLGQTLPEIRVLLPENAVAEKITFDAFGSGDFTRRLEPLRAAGRRHLVFCGMEAHVDPPPLNWSTLKYVLWQRGGSCSCRGSVTSPKRSSRSCGRSMSWSRRADPSPMPFVRLA